ncbi:17667_t:CDS:2 [Racocetra fulgida]|uniref:17667_t:CDS:1 n=1 Tax=Racocetra fulgida TaxID=60492 RepID=A0A9N9DHZ5_9GLOM|nr:17667_t:CDS:2 [Racocetra fulgida]
MGIFLLVIYLTPLGDFKVDHHDELIAEDIEVDLKAEASLLGLSSFVGVTLEIVVFYFGKHISESTVPEICIIRIFWYNYESLVISPD